MISLHGEATRGAFPMSSTNKNCHYLIFRIHKMLKKLTSRNLNQRNNKVKLALRTWVVLAVGVWMIYQLRVFLSQKLSSEDGVSVKEETHTELLKLGRKGLILTNSDTRKPDEKSEGGAEDMEDEKRKGKHENQQGMEGESEDLVDGVDKGGDVDDEELDSVRFDDPMEEIESLEIESLDDGDDDEGDDNAATDQHSEGEDDKADTKISEVKSR